jgi:ATP-GRASP peptide maturase of grasp-with-spasm system
MILLLSQDCFEISTEEVQDWIEALGHETVRLNGADLNGDVAFSLEYGGGGAGMSIDLDGRTLTAGDVDAVWSRRWHTYDNLAFVDGVPDERLRNDLRGYLTGELRAASSGLFDALRGREWLTRPGQSDVNKLAVLRRAAEAGLEIPATLVTNDRARLQAFMREHGRIITKSLWNGRTFMQGRDAWSLLTYELRQEDVDGAPERFFPSLVQALLEKDLEVRTFYLDGECWSMAIFSQLDRQTSIDFRHYNFRRPNRFVPYRLPAEVEEGARTLMRGLALDTGSLDFVRTPDGRHVFLEVNPVGQFQMVSVPCNYNLEKKMAERLIERARHV